MPEITSQDWISFNIGVVILIFIDLLIFHRKAKKESFQEAMGWSLFWVALSLAFNYYIYQYMGEQAATEFLTAYILEKSLSVDNLFVFFLIFQYFKIPPEYQHRALFYGILGAIVMRAFFIYTGVELIHRFHSIIYLFGAILIYSGVSMLRVQDEEEFKDNIVTRLAKAWLPFTEKLDGQNITTKLEGKTVFTPMLLTIIALETSDIIFAVDSIPAVLGVTNSAYIAYTSNIMAILGLRSLYFCLAYIIDTLEYLPTGLAFILIFIGIKMLGESYFTITPYQSLIVIISILSISIIASLIHYRKKQLTGKDDPTKENPTDLENES